MNAVRDGRIAVAEALRRRGTFDEATKIALEVVDDELLPPLDRAWGCLVATSALAEQGRSDEALTWLSESVDLANVDERALGPAALSFITVIRWSNDVLGAEIAGRALLEWAQLVDDSEIVVRATILLASALRETGQAIEAITLCATARGTAVHAADAMLLVDLDDTRVRALEQIGRVDECLEQMIAIERRCTDLGMDPLRIEVLVVIARLKRLLGDPTGAIASHRVALAEPLTAIMGYTRLAHLRGAALSCELLGDDAGAYAYLKESITVDESLRASERDYRRAFLLSGSSLAIARLQATSPLVTQLRLQANQLSTRFHRDRLTGARDRSGFLERVEQRKHAGPCTLAVVDVRDFTAINTSYGFSTGSAVLIEIFDRLCRFAPRSIDIGRIGSDSFALVGEATPDEMSAIILSTVATPFRVGSRDIRLSVSIGAVAVDPEMEAERALTGAELASHQGSGGHARTELFTRELETNNQRRMIVAQGLRAANLDEQMVVHYQVIVDRQLRTHAFEALARWNHPSLGPVGPAEFIPVAEQIGEIDRIGAWVMRQTMATAARHSVRFGINVSSVQLMDDRLAGELEEAMAEYHLTGERIVLEVTETAIFTAGQRAVQALHGLRSSGVSIVLDDFGTGFSSIAHLLDVPASAIKLDMSYVRELPHSARHRRAVQGVIELANGMGIEAIAEGVESTEQFEILRDMGCEYFQGYLFSKPVPRQAIETETVPRDWTPR